MKNIVVPAFVTAIALSGAPALAIVVIAAGALLLFAGRRG